MPVIKVYHHGVTAAMPPSKNSHERAKRGVVNGWSKSAARNNTRWLRSISPDSFGNDEEFGVAFTFTLRDCPDSSDEWHKLRRAFIERLRRLGMLRLHWVTEWQRRGVPHLHGIVFFSYSSCLSQTDVSGLPLPLDSVIKNHWVDLAKKYGASPYAQDLKTVTDIKGWFKYLSKHASRGAEHYQRSSEGIPSGWIKTGRVWGHCGDWKTDEAVQLNVSNGFYFALRRIVRKWRLSDARDALKRQPMMKLDRDKYFFLNPHWLSAKKRISSARRMLKSNDLKKSQVRGVSEWIDSENILLVAEMLIAQGYEIYLSDEEEARL